LENSTVEIRFYELIGIRKIKMFKYIEICIAVNKYFGCATVELLVFV